MKWIEVRVETTSEGLEPVGAALLESGVNGFQVEDDKDMLSFYQDNPLSWDYIDESLAIKEAAEPAIVFYVSDNAAGRDTLSCAKKSIGEIRLRAPEIDFGRLEITQKSVDDEDWLHNWKKYYKPFAAGNRLLIRPVWEDCENPEGRMVLSIDPGCVFGTGLHQTTKMCLEALERYIKEGFAVLDCGSGSGILSVAALMLGAGSVAAADIDPNARDIAYKNAEANGFTSERFFAETGDILSDDEFLKRITARGEGGRFDLVVANIVADVIIPLTRLIAERDILNKAGMFISSGIIRDRLEETRRAIEASGFDILETLTSGEWVCICARAARPSGLQFGG